MDPRALDFLKSRLDTPGEPETQDEPVWPATEEPEVDPGSLLSFSERLKQLMHTMDANAAAKVAPKETAEEYSPQEKTRLPLQTGSNKHPPVEGLRQPELSTAEDKLQGQDAPTGAEKNQPTPTSVESQMKEMVSKEQGGAPKEAQGDQVKQGFDWKSMIPTTGQGPVLQQPELSSDPRVRAIQKLQMQARLEGGANRRSQALAMMGHDFIAASNPMQVGQFSDWAKFAGERPEQSKLEMQDQLGAQQYGVALQQQDLQKRMRDPNSQESQNARDIVSKLAGVPPELIKNQSADQIKQYFPLVEKYIATASTAASKEAGATGMRDLIWNDPQNKDFLEAQGIKSRADMDKIPDEALRAMQTDYTARRSQGIKSAQEIEKENRQFERQRALVVFNDDLTRRREEWRNNLPKPMDSHEIENYDKLKEAQYAIQRYHELWKAVGGNVTLSDLKTNVARLPEWARGWMGKDLKNQGEALQALDDYKLTVLDPAIRALSGIGVRQGVLPAYKNYLPSPSYTPEQAEKRFGQLESDAQHAIDEYTQTLGQTGRKTPQGTISQPVPQQPKKIDHYLQSPDGTRRVPVYSDGSKGPEEKVP